MLDFTKTALKNGTFSFEFDNETVRPEPADWLPCHEGGGRVTLANKLTVWVSCREDRLTIRFRNGKNPLLLKSLHLEFPPALPARDYQEYTHSRLFLEQASGVKPVGLSTTIFENNPPSYMLYQLSPRNHRGLSMLFAALPPNRGEFLVFQAIHETPDMRGKFGLRITAEESRSIAPHVEFAVSDILFEATEDDPVVQLEKLGDMYASCRQFKSKDVQCGWNSWDEMHTTVTPEKVMAAAEALRGFSGGRIDTFVVDDGWQIAYGAWTPNGKFPHNIGDFCEEAAQLGGTPGIWTAPLCLSNQYMVPQEWVAETSDPSRRWVLDITHPGAQDHIRKIYRGLYHAGFRYFKVDFTNCILAADKLYDMSYGKAGVLHKLYELIRESVGSDSYFLGCCVPFEPAFDLVDAVRTTADIQIHWSCVEINMTSAAARWWMHRKLWNNDPDFLVIRGSETSCRKLTGRMPYVAGKYGSGPVLDLREAMTLALALYMTAGDLILSDNFTEINESGRQILRHILAMEPLKKAARPVDLYTAPTGEPPSRWFDPQSGKLALFNWSDDQREMPIGASGCFDHFFWNEKEIQTAPDGTLWITLAPHESTGILLQNTPAMTDDVSSR